MIKSRVSYSGHRRLVNRRCPAYGHPRFTGRRCPSVKFPVLKVKISTFAAVSPPGSSSCLILRHLRLICSTYLVFGEVWTTAKSKIIQRLKVLECTLKFNMATDLFLEMAELPALPATGSLGTGQLDTRDLLVAGVPISISSKYLYLYLALKVLTLKVKIYSYFFNALIFSYIPLKSQKNIKSDISGGR